ncbi:hypothetical protein KZZ52_19980 [Dactylosporangium sp. AC04546]|uniref:HAD domain-containing protein n=1 Tax=Dactylosporangium sp. AC04546 TaxID=2862460 RepID=UPI001EE023EE|nr:hypothetical protein [Dactylosporangium sp. AC04546]WVK87574.1 hypothetical protein KZZ52_19980 [Dactylosporangium sp. AC04546]
MTAPVWLLDVDGVINVKQPAWHAKPWTGTACDARLEYRMRWAPQLTTRIRQLHRAGVVEVRWCTTWCAYADQLERLFRLPVLDRAFTDDLDGDDVPPVKLAAARAVLAEGRRLVWTDDAEVPEPGPLFDELAAGGRALLIRPDARRGLTPADVDAIEAFSAAPGRAPARRG